MENCQKLKIVEPHLHAPNFLQDISNSRNLKSGGSVQRFLSWPDHDQLNQSGKRRKSRDKMPSILSGAEWQRIIQIQENKKLAKTKEAEPKRKIKIEKQDEIRIKNKSDQIKKEEHKLRKAQLKFE